MTMPIDLVLVRHGESEGNVALRHSKKGDDRLYTPEFKARHPSHYRLTNKGRGQAEAAGKVLREQFPRGFDRYFVSDYVRAIETAALMDLPGALWRNSFRLREREWGDLDILSIQEVEERFAESAGRRQQHPFYWIPPNGESLANLCDRIDRFLDTLHRESEKQQVVVVCHGEVMWAFRFLIERLTPYKWQQLDDNETIKNCQIIHYTRVDPQGSHRAEAVNWRRMIVPSDGEVGEWERIERRTYSNEQSLKYVALYPPIIEESS